MLRQISEAGKAVADLGSSIARKEAKVREAVDREVRLLNTWDASNFTRSAISVPVDATMVLNLDDTDPLSWLDSLVNPEFVGGSLLEQSNL